MTNTTKPERAVTDLLRMDYINSLPQPLFANFCTSSDWPVHDIDVQTGLLRIDACGMLDVKHIRSVLYFRDADGVRHDPESFYYDADATSPVTSEGTDAGQG